MQITKLSKFGNQSILDRYQLLSAEGKEEAPYVTFIYILQP